MINKDLSKEIEELLLKYIKINSQTGTALEKESEYFLLSYLRGIDYFAVNSDYFGAYNLENDPFDRSVIWAMVKGAGSETVILLHHNDVVDISDYKSLKNVAYSPEELAKELMKSTAELDKEVVEDLESGEFMFGRGTADMKAGGSIQLVLLKHYSELKNFKGNIVLISVPDEENLSAGMRGAVSLLRELKINYGLDYKGVINSEPHQRKGELGGVIAEGSIGKIMPYVHVRGTLAHIGKVFDGFNPVPLLSRIVTNTDLNPNLTEAIEGQITPPPTWVYLKDDKDTYDVSMPMSISGYLSILTFTKKPKEIMDIFIDICTKSFKSHLRDLNKKYKGYCEISGIEYTKLKWKPKVMSFAQLYDKAIQKHGYVFEKNYKDLYENIDLKISQGMMTMVEGTNRLLDYTFNYIDDNQPVVVVALAPPYYPSVANVFFKDRDDDIRDLTSMLDEYSKKRYGIGYCKENFFTGISDLSYTAVHGSTKEVGQTINSNMPLFGDIYNIPFEDIEDLCIPSFNIGPWGKDLHKFTERVNIEELLYKAPDIINKGIEILLDLQ